MKMITLRRFLGSFLVVAVSSILLALLLLGIRRSAAIRSEACRLLAPEPRGAADLPHLRLLEDGGIAMVELKGRLVMLHFWASHCKACVEELPSLARLEKSFASRDLVLLMVSRDEEKDIATRFLDDKELSFSKLLFDPKGTVSEKYGVRKYPETLLFGRGGQFLFHFVGVRDWSTPQARGCLLTHM